MMKKVTITLFWLILPLLVFTRITLAVSCEYDFQPDPATLVEGEFNTIILSVRVWDTGPDDLYTISSDGLAFGTPELVRFRKEGLKPGADGWLPTQTITTPRLLKAGNHFFSIINERLGGEYCERISFTVAPAPTPTSSFVNCRLKATADDNKFTASSIITVEGSGVPSIGGYGNYYNLRVVSRDGQVDKSYSITVVGKSFSKELGSFTYKTYDVVLQTCDPLGSCSDTSCRTYFTIDPKKGGAPTPLPTGVRITPLPPAKLEDICKGAENLNDCIECIRGIGKYDGRPGMWTALGCIPTDIPTILKDYVFPTGLGIAGGIAFLLILFGGFKILTSAGNPEEVAKGKEMITSALAGLLLIIFSVFILRLIGVEILKIPGFE